MKEYNKRHIMPRYATILLTLALTLTLGACKKNMIHPELDVTFLPQKGTSSPRTVIDWKWPRSWR